MNKAGVHPMAIEWCRDPGLASEVARFFIAHAEPSYISHSELQFGRASIPGRWSDDLEARIADEAQRAIANGVADASAGQRLAVVREDGLLTAMAFVTFVPEAATPFAILDDLLVGSPSRGEGFGRAILDWIVAACRRRGLRRLFLESGLANHRAHHFFKQQGFAQTSIVMMREL